MREFTGPFQYFTLAEGFTGYGSSQMTDDKGESRVVMVKVNNTANKEEASRVRVTDGTYHTKAIVRKPGKELTGADSEFAYAIALLYYGEQVLAVPTHEIKDQFDSRESLKLLLSNPNSIFPVEIERKTRIVVSYLLGEGIDINHIGIYGGLQTHLIHLQEEPTIKDVDVLIYGLEYMPLVKKLADKTRTIRTIAHPTTTGVDQSIRNKRHEISKIYIPGFGGELYCDVKVVHAETDSSSFIPDVEIKEDCKVFEGIVTDDSEVLCSTPVFKVAVGQETFTVASAQYNYIGSARKGDSIRVSAASTDHKNYYVLLTDPSKNHGIEYL